MESGCYDLFDGIRLNLEMDDIVFTGSATGKVVRSRYQMKFSTQSVPMEA